MFEGIKFWPSYIPLPCTWPAPPTQPGTPNTLAVYDQNTYKLEPISDTPLLFIHIGHTLQSLYNRRDQFASEGPKEWPSHIPQPWAWPALAAAADRVECLTIPHFANIPYKLPNRSASDYNRLALQIPSRVHTVMLPEVPPINDPAFGFRMRNLTDIGGNIKQCTIPLLAEPKLIRSQRQEQMQGNVRPSLDRCRRLHQQACSKQQQETLQRLAGEVSNRHGRA